MGPLEFAAATAAVAIGSIVQAVSGVGAGFLMVPMLAFIDLRLVPGPMIFASLSLSGIMAFRERGAIDTANLSIILLGLVPGCLLGGFILSVIPPERLGIAFGSVLLFAIAMTAMGLRLPFNRITAVSAAAMSGAMGASTGIGAPALALLYQDQAGPQIRSTLALLYTIASALIIMVLALFGRFGAEEAWNGLLLMPGFMMGYLAANRLRLPVDRDRSRIAVLVVSAVAALVLLLKSLN